MTGLDHERLTVYQIALDFVVIADDVAGAFPPGRSYLADQLHRAATSVVLNVAEGAGEFSKKEKARFYRMARRSATESAATLDVGRVLHLADEKKLSSGRELLLRIVPMLVSLIRGLASEDDHGADRGTGRGKGTGTDVGRPSGPQKG
jgi:four helix bundle protein